MWDVCIGCIKSYNMCIYIYIFLHLALDETSLFSPYSFSIQDDKRACLRSSCTSSICVIQLSNSLNWERVTGLIEEQTYLPHTDDLTYIYRIIYMYMYTLHRICIYMCILTYILCNFKGRKIWEAKLTLGPRDWVVGHSVPIHLKTCMAISGRAIHHPTWAGMETTETTGVN